MAMPFSQTELNVYPFFPSSHTEVDSMESRPSSRLAAALTNSVTSRSNQGDSDDGEVDDEVATIVPNQSTMDRSQDQSHGDDLSEDHFNPYSDNSKYYEPLPKGKGASNGQDSQGDDKKSDYCLPRHWANDRYTGRVNISTVDSLLTNNKSSYETPTRAKTESLIGYKLPPVTITAQPNQGLHPEDEYHDDFWAQETILQAAEAAALEAEAQAKQTASSRGGCRPSSRDTSRRSEAKRSSS